MTSGASLKLSAAERLIGATLESIHRHGLAATSVTTVTGIAGLSRGMVRHEFGSKQRMIIEALTRVCDSWLAATEPNTALTGPEQVREIVRAMFNPAVFTPVALDSWFALSVAARSDPELGRIRDAAQHRWTDQLTRAFSASGVEAPETAARGLMATADGLWFRARLTEGASAIDEAMQATMRIADALLAVYSSPTRPRNGPNDVG